MRTWFDGERPPWVEKRRPVVIAAPHRDAPFHTVVAAAALSNAGNDNDDRVVRLSRPVHLSITLDVACASDDGHDGGPCLCDRGPWVGCRGYRQPVLGGAWQCAPTVIVWET